MNTTVTAHEADEQFTDLLSRAEKGETVVITRNGKPVAQLIACSKPFSEQERQKAWDRLLAMMERGLHLGGGKFDRESAYDDR